MLIRLIGFAPLNASADSSTETCWEAGAVRLSAAQTKAHLRHMLPIFSPLLRQMRMEILLLVEIGIDPQGNVTCVRVNSGHPIIIAAAMESIRQWKFRSLKSCGQKQAAFGKLIVDCFWARHGFKTVVLKAAPHKHS